MASGTVSLSTYAPVGNANFLNPANGKYYADAAFTVEATDDTATIQKAIKYAWDYSKAVLNFDQGKKNYLINGELCVYGDDLTINANGCNLIRATNNGGVLGSVFSIYGLRPNLTYPGVGFFTGASKAAKRIIVNDLNIKFSPLLPFNYVNGFSGVHVQDSAFNRCTCDYAQQTAFALVSDVIPETGLILAVNNVTLTDCKSTNSRKHSFRQSAIRASLYHKSKLVNCTATNTLEFDKNYNMTPPTDGRKVHLLCNVSASGAGTFSMISQGCNFDTTGHIFLTGYCKNVVLQGCTYSYYDKKSTSLTPIVS